MGHQLVIVGGGNMGAALLTGLLAGGSDPATLAVTETLPGRRDELNELFPDVTVTEQTPPCAAAVIAVVRAMPNTPALVGAGAAAIAGGATATDDDLAWAERILGAVGTVERVDEKHLDAVTALTGSGPAYLFLVAEALIDAGVLAGLPRPLAARLTTQLLVGSAALLAERGDPAGLRAMVTSPGGTTAAGLHVLEERAVRAAFGEAVRAAARRSVELGS